MVGSNSGPGTSMNTLTITAQDLERLYNEYLTLVDQAQGPLESAVGVGFGRAVKRLMGLWSARNGEQPRVSIRFTPRPSAAGGSSPAPSRA